MSLFSHEEQSPGSSLRRFKKQQFYHQVVPSSAQLMGIKEDEEQARGSVDDGLYSSQIVEYRHYVTRRQATFSGSSDQSLLNSRTEQPPCTASLSSSSAIPEYLERPPLQARIHRVDLFQSARQTTPPLFPRVKPRRHIPRLANYYEPSFCSEGSPPTHHIRYELPPSRLPLVHVPISSHIVNSFAVPNPTPTRCSSDHQQHSHRSIPAFSTFRTSPCDAHRSPSPSHPFLPFPPSMSCPPSMDAQTHLHTRRFDSHVNDAYVGLLSHSSPKQISQARAAGIRPVDLLYRALEPKDFIQCQQLHQEWFPITYGKHFYDAACKGGIYSLGAVYHHTSNRRTERDERRPEIYSHTDCDEEVAPPNRRDEDNTVAAYYTSGDNFPEEEEDCIAGIITLSQRPNLHLRSDDVELILNHEVAEAIRSCGPLERPSGDDDDHAETDSAPITKQEFRVDCRFHLAYILTLGVAENFRGIGLASELIRKAIRFFMDEDPNFQIVYLHVAGYNHEAIRLYDRLGFRCIHRYPDFYNIGGQLQDALLYAYYCSPREAQPLWNRFR